MVFRTAKWQIADDNARLYVVSSADQVHWRYEGTFEYERDLREPRFLVWQGHLFLYFALLGSELALVFRRRRTWAMLGALAAVPILIAVAVRLTTGEDSGGPAFLGSLSAPSDVAIFGNTLFIADNGNDRIRAVDRLGRDSERR